MPPSSQSMTFERLLQRGRAPESAEIREWRNCSPCCATLQRGRAPESAEIYGERHDRAAHGLASTGPRSGERGDLLEQVRQWRIPRASTGPRSGERGDGANGSWGGQWGGPLQRGRAPESAEIAEATRTRPARPKLQRGRAPESAEMGRQRHRHEPRRCASTGPRSGERGDPAPDTVKDGYLMLQRGRAPESAEMWSRTADRLVFGWLQRGRAPESAEISLAQVLRTLGWELQRGRAPESAEMWSGWWRST